VRSALTIAGSDSIAGAGIQADLKTFAALGVLGTCAITAVTAQNTSGVVDVHPLSPDIVRSQIDAVSRDIPPSAVKTGMLATHQIVETVVEALSAFPALKLVVDPVMLAGAPGARTLLRPEAVEILKARLLPMALVVTPNVAEATALSGIEVRSRASAIEAAKRILGLGVRAVVVKGGHLEGRDAIDLLLDGASSQEFSAPRVDVGRVHGAGCTFASAIAAGLAMGDELPAAVQRAKNYVTGAIKYSSAPGAGARLLSHFWIYTS